MDASPPQDTDYPHIEIRTLADLRPDTQNVRVHPEHNIRLIAQSMQETGAMRSVVVDGDSDDELMAGTGAVTGAEMAGIERVIIVETDGNSLVAVRRRGLTAEQKARYRLMDNAATDSSHFDASGLGAMAAKTPDLLAGIFAPEQIADYANAFTASFSQAAAEEGDEDDEPALPDGDAPRVFADEQILESAFAYFRAAGFPYRRLPRHVCMQELNRLAATPADRLLHTDLGYAVADTYHPHRFHAAAEGMKSPYESFHADPALRHALALMLTNQQRIGTEYFGKLSIVHGTQACSNFRPGFAALLYRRYCEPGDTVLDTSTGYGGRLVGFLASGIAGRYIGIDPNLPTYEGNLRLAADLGFAPQVELYQCPAEDLDPALVAGRADFAFTSPPYFAKEHYADDATQSWRRYPTGDAWRVGFLEPLLALQFAALKPGKFAVLNIADVKLRNQTFPLVEWALAAATRTGFTYLRTDVFTLAERFGEGQEQAVASEPVLIFQKPAA